MKRRLGTACAVGAALLSPLAATRLLGIAVGDVHGQVEAGQRVFATSCANCHGAGGKGAIGPGLIDKHLTADLVQTTVLNGRVGTPMPPFRDELDNPSLAAVIAYVVSIGSGGHQPTEPVTVQAAAAANAVSSQPVAIGQERGTPARGAELFFDATNVHACRSCHSFGDRGGPVGPDLSKSPKTAAQVLEQLTHARVAAADYPAITLRLRDGSTFDGVKADESTDAVIVYDVGVEPPVRRTFAKSELQDSATADGGRFDHTKLPYSRQDRLDLAAYLGSTPKK